MFVGPPYAGKDTQAKLLAKKLDLPVFSMGQLIREAREAGNPKAIEGFQNYSLKGLHLPISLKFDLLKEQMDKSKKGFILDNFPATKEDLEAIIDYLNKYSLKVSKVFYLYISEEEIMKRMRLNRGRLDDSPEIVMKRVEVQNKDRIPVLEYFKEIGVLKKINGEQSIEKVQSDIINQLG